MKKQKHFESLNKKLEELNLENKRLEQVLIEEEEKRREVEKRLKAINERTGA